MRTLPIAAGDVARDEFFVLPISFVIREGIRILARRVSATEPGKQRGDPVRGSQAIIAALESDRPPLHLVIGGDALDLARAELEDLRHDFDTWERLTRSTDYEA